MHDAILKDLKLLLVDDDIESCELVEMMLSQRGAQVTRLNSGSEALARPESFLRFERLNDLFTKVAALSKPPHR